MVIMKRSKYGPLIVFQITAHIKDPQEVKPQVVKPPGNHYDEPDRQNCVRTLNPKIN